MFTFLALFIFSSNLGRRGSWSPVEQVAVEMTAPAQNLLAKIIGYVEGWWLHYFHLVDLRKENTRMKAEIAVMGKQATMDLKGTVRMDLQPGKAAKKPPKP